MEECNGLLGANWKSEDAAKIGADILRKELSSERQSIKHLPAFDPYAEG